MAERNQRCPRCDAVLAGPFCAACGAPSAADGGPSSRSTDTLTAAPPPVGQPLSSAPGSVRRSPLVPVLVAACVAVAIVTAGVVTAVVLRDDDGRAESAEPAASPVVPTTVTVTTTTAPIVSWGPGATSPVDETIVDIAAGNPELSTLVELVVAAGLGETLSGEGPFTVFAPTNSAFAALDPATVEALKADPQGALAQLLALHVISGNVDAAAATAAAGTCVETLGGKVLLEATGAGLSVDGAPIVATDIMGSNGIIHVIDGLITTSSEGC